MDPLGVMLARKLAADQVRDEFRESEPHDWRRPSVMSIGRLCRKVLRLRPMRTPDCG